MTSRQTLSRGSATPKFRSVNVLTNDISRQCIVAMIRPCSEPSGKRVTVNRIDREREREEKKDEELERGKSRRRRRRRCVGTIDEFLCPGYRSFSIIHLRSGLL